MIKTNKDKLLEIGVIGAITHPAVEAGYMNSWDGTPAMGLGRGGIVYNVKPGDSCWGWASGEKVEPGVSVDGVGNEGAVGSFRNFTCIGNPAKVVAGTAKGAEGVVVGKVGGVLGAHHVVVHFKEEDLENLAIGDKIQVKSSGVGLSFTDYPEVRAVGLSPQLLEDWRITEKEGKLIVPIVKVVPADYVGQGHGGSPSEASSWNVMTQDPEAVRELKDLRLGDVVALKDTLSAWGRGYYEGAYTVGVVSSGASSQLGHGINVTTMLTCKGGEVEPKVAKGTNIVKLLKLGGP